MKALCNPNIDDLLENGLDINGLKHVEVQSNGSTIWINIHGICVIRLGHIEVIDVDFPSYENTFISEQPSVFKISSPDLLSFSQFEEAIEIWQNCNHVHHLSCGNNSTHSKLVPRRNSKGKFELYCPECSFIQPSSNIPDVVFQNYFSDKKITDNNPLFSSVVK